MKEVRAILVAIIVYFVSAIFVGSWLGIVIWQAQGIAGMRLW